MYWRIFEFLLSYESKITSKTIWIAQTYRSRWEESTITKVSLSENYSDYTSVFLMIFEKVE